MICAFDVWLLFFPLGYCLDFCTKVNTIIFTFHFLEQIIDKVFAKECGHLTKCIIHETRFMEPELLAHQIGISVILPM